MLPKTDIIRNHNTLIEHECNNFLSLNVKKIYH